MKRAQSKSALIRAVAVMLTANVAGWVPAHADEVEDAMKEALEAYKNKDYKAATESLDYATTLIRQQKGNVLESYLPDPLEGWKAEDAESAAAGTAFMGGGVSAQRVFTKDDKTVTVALVTDSPMLSGMMMMFGNPMFATSDGGKMQRINGQKAMVKRGEVTMAVNNTLVTINGNADETELIAYAKGVDVEGLAKQ